MKAPGVVETCKGKQATTCLTNEKPIIHVLYYKDSMNPCRLCLAAVKMNFQSSPGGALMIGDDVVK